MSKISAAITAVGAYVPDYVLTNDILATMVDTNDEWITTRTGIKERRILKKEGEGTSYLAIKAAQDLLEKKKLDPAEIDMVIVATATPDMPVASTAVYTASKIGAVNAFAYDLSAACSSFLYGMSTAASLFEPNEEGLGFQDEYLRSDGIGRDFLKIDAGGSILPTSQETLDNAQHTVFQDGKTVFKFAVSNMADVSDKIMKRNNLSGDDVDFLIAHQG